MTGYRKDFIGFSKKGSKGSDFLPELPEFKNGVLEACLTGLESRFFNPLSGCKCEPPKCLNNKPSK